MTSWLAGPGRLRCRPGVANDLDIAKMSPRRRARAVALQVLYAMDSVEDLDPGVALATHLREFGVSQDEDTGDPPEESRGEPVGSADGAPSREAERSERGGGGGWGPKGMGTLPGFPLQ